MNPPQKPTSNNPSPPDALPSWADDRWVSDMNNDLGVFGLTAGDEHAVGETHRDEMGCIPQSGPHDEEKLPPKHEAVGP